MNDYVSFSASSGAPSGAGVADVIIAGLQSAAQSYQAFLASQRGIYYPQVSGAGVCPQGYIRNAQGVCVPLTTTSSVLGGVSLSTILLIGAAVVLAIVLVKR